MPRDGSLDQAEQAFDGQGEKRCRDGAFEHQGHVEFVDPRRIGRPYPPAPMNPPSVAVPTLITAAIRTPARIIGAASGSSMRHRLARGGSPSAAADSRSDSGIPTSPACVFRTIGSRLYKNKAAMAGGRSSLADQPH